MTKPRNRKTPKTTRNPALVSLKDPIFIIFNSKIKPLNPSKCFCSPIFEGKKNIKTPQFSFPKLPQITCFLQKKKKKKKKQYLKTLSSDGGGGWLVVMTAEMVYGDGGRDGL
ncbi:hypothetical protein HanXRQr2_Chr02g0069991 [Helianthus annuus]|uniref:Uncharacterized protein n=1 Tax=Helianthus annuus TaxID=4232 RepID=A0A9K3JPP4_HELAN|nr:hypothetical protein HanXRQr2_Chr02g0069991 [Helianthus annuus]KAJ0952085.1 hypothetical protein HanPSC8_Chr02g0068011 [Helianthus annuus]